MSYVEKLPPSGRVLEGTWEEISHQAQQFGGRRLRVLVLPVAEVSDSAPSRPFHETATPEEWVAAYLTWGRDHAPRNACPLSDDEISRESIYGERLDKQR